MAVIPNLVSSTLSRGSGGWLRQVEYLVTDTPGLLEAINAVGIAHGAADGEITGIFALDFAARAEAEDPQVKRVTVGYRQPQGGSTNDDGPPPPISSGGTTQLSTRVQGEKRAKDIDGFTIEVQHTYTGGQSTNTTPVFQPGQLDVFIPSTVLSIERTESDSPIQLAKDHVGTLNQGAFFGEPAGLWLCTGIEGQSDDNGSSYSVAYEFEYKFDGWQGELIFTDPSTGKPIEGYQQGIEQQQFDVYRKTNFGAMNLE